MAKNVKPGLDEDEDYDEDHTMELANMKAKRKTLRRQITVTNRQVETLTNYRGSRGAIQGLLLHLNDLILRTSQLQTDISTLEDDEEEAERQDANHLIYVTRVGELAADAQDYIKSRDGEAASIVGSNVIPGQDPPLPPVSPSEILRREQARQDEIAATRLRAERAREQAVRTRQQADRAWEEADTAQAALRLLGVELYGRPAPPDDDHFTSVSQQIDNTTPQAKALLDQQRQKNSDSNPETPDTWIDLYSTGRLTPVVTARSTRSSVSAELEPFDGKALEWFSWIDLFRALVHDTPKSPGEKLALLKRFLRGDCLDLVYGLGGGEAAYIEALVRLKQTCGRRDVMRAAHHQAIQRLETKQDPASFKRFAERIRTHLFDLSRIGETGTTDLIEKICLKLHLHDRLAWNEDRRGRIEDRNLNTFGRWLCSRASAYQNAFSIAADQVNPASSKPTNQRRQAWTNQSSAKMAGEKKQVAFQFSGKPFCFKCEKGHRLPDCEDFKLLSVGERLTFCMRRRLCFSCFSTKHSVHECDRRRPCKHSGCGYYHHPLLHTAAKETPRTETEERARPTIARIGAPRKVTMGMLRLPVMAEDGSWVSANIFFDEGSDSTLMRSAFATALKLRGPRQILAVDGAGGIINRYPSTRVQFRVRAVNGNIFSLEGSTMKTVASPTPITDWNKEKYHWSHLKNLLLGETGGKVDVLIGLDYAHLLAVRDSRVGEEKEPIASKTAFGWVVPSRT
ncbi:uncharacterized protein LOC123473813 [Daphnia magna]|uniref:uncharacterized protein LOC123473813 n=1 Tax=Daphnia magna TaxID=35525 RepID=UPI001E1BCB05|nr:uncharacterized protein LOC123473813 [Daphnia magna]